jgi:hypothetical protein
MGKLPVSICLTLKIFVELLTNGGVTASTESDAFWLRTLVAFTLLSSTQCWVLQQYIQLANCLLIIGALNNGLCGQVLQRFVLPHNCSLAIALNNAHCDQVLRQCVLSYLTTARLPSPSTTFSAALQPSTVVMCSTS